MDECVEVGRLPLPLEGEQDVLLSWRREEREESRIYIHARGVFFSYEWLASVGVAKPYLGVGIVSDVLQRGSVCREFCTLEGIYYPGSKVLALLSCDIWGPYRESENPQEDFLLAVLFDSFEGVLRRTFSGARMAEVGHEPNYPQSLWGGFLSSRGYERWQGDVYRKALAC